MVSLALGIATTIGVAILARLCKTPDQPWLLLVPVGAAMGIALTSVTMLLWLVLPEGLDYVKIEMGLAIVIVATLWRGSREPTAGTDEPAVLRRLGLISLAVMIIAGGWAAASMVQHFSANPYGQWDAWSMWNLKAKLLHAGGDSWAIRLRDGSPHPDYPLLQPASIARLWKYAGTDSHHGPQAFAMACLLLTVSVTVGGVWHLRGMLLGAAAGLATCASSMVLREASSQYADMALAMFSTAACASLAVAMHNAAPRGCLFIVAGFMAGAACWTKNEGLAFAAALGMAIGLGTLIAFGWRRGAMCLVYYLLGLVPLVVVTLMFKATVAGHSDLWPGRAWSDVVALLTDPQRHARIARMASFVWRHGPNFPVTCAMLSLPILIGPALDRRALATTAMIGTTLGIQLVLIYGVYLMTPHDLGWHLVASADRLFVHLWPTTVLLLFVLLRPPKQWWCHRFQQAEP